MRRTVVVLVATLAALLLTVGTAGLAAAAGDVIVPKTAGGGTAVTMKAASDSDSISGSMTVTNLAAVERSVTIKGTGSLENCNFDGDQLPAESSTSLDIKSSACDLGTSGGKVTLGIVGATPSELTVTLTPDDVSDRVVLGDVVRPFVIAAVIALVPLLLVVLWAVQESGSKNVWFEDLDSVPPDWSFKDSWASNISVVASLFVAIFGATDTLTAIFGEDPEELTSKLLVVAAFSGLFVGMAPLVLKAFGKTQAPTVAGLVVGGWLTLIGAGGQIIAVYEGFQRDAFAAHDGNTLSDVFHLLKGWDLGTWIALALLLFLLYYASRTILQLLRKSFEDPEPAKPTTELLIAAALVLAAGPDRKLQEAHTAAAEYLEQQVAAAEGDEADRAKGQRPAGPPPAAPPGFTFGLSRVAVPQTRSGVL